MNNVGVTWEQIVALARALEIRGGRNAPPQDPVLLARLVIEFHRDVVAQPLKRTHPDAACQALPIAGCAPSTPEGLKGVDAGVPRREEAAA
jgi:hypothetical protein